jgi:L-threonylcarbamoyladenylate synthase
MNPLNSIYNIDTATINKAAAILKAGGIVAFPTETVYGLGADAANEAACRRIFAAKGRPLGHPLIVHIASINELPNFAREIPPIAVQLANAFWPGPLTLILKKQNHVLDIVTGGESSVGLRVPSHPIARQLLRAFGGGIAAPSANKFTYISATNAEAVENELGADIDYIIDGGASTLGLESTIIDVSNELPCILRPGMISTSMLAKLGLPILFSQKRSPTHSTTRAPGMHPLHYAPRTNTSLVDTEFLPGLLQSLTSLDLPAALLTHTFIQKECYIPNVHIVNMPKVPNDYAYLLYRELRKLDHLNYRRIIIERVPDEADWHAIQDRLLKASSLKKI